MKTGLSGDYVAAVVRLEILQVKRGRRREDPRLLGPLVLPSEGPRLPSQPQAVMLPFDPAREGGERGRRPQATLKHNKEALQDSCHSQAQITEPETQPLGELTLTKEPGAEGTTWASCASEQDSAGPVNPCESRAFYAAVVPAHWLCVSSVSLIPRTLNSPHRTVLQHRRRATRSQVRP